MRPPFPLYPLVLLQANVQGRILTACLILAMGQVVPVVEFLKWLDRQQDNPVVGAVLFVCIIVYRLELWKRLGRKKRAKKAELKKGAPQGG